MIKYYVRVSTVEQKLNRQLLAYDKADIVYSDKVSGKDKECTTVKYCVFFEIKNLKIIIKIINWHIKIKMV